MTVQFTCKLIEFWYLELTFFEGLFSKILSWYNFSYTYTEGPWLVFWREHFTVIYFYMGQSIQEWTNQNLWKTTFYLVHSWILYPISDVVDTFRLWNSFLTLLIYMTFFMIQWGYALKVWNTFCKYLNSDLRSCLSEQTIYPW